MLYLAYLITFLLFIGSAILFLIGWPVEGDLVENTRYYPAFYILIIFYVLKYVFPNKFFDERIKYVTYIFIGVVAAYCAGKILKGGGSINALVRNIMLPALYASFFLQPALFKYRHKVRKLLLAMFCLNALLALYERTFTVNIFPLDNFSYMDFTIESDWDKGIFRSTALLGHPLTNALLMAIIMGFILITDYLKPLYKYSLYALGVVSLFCFNARGSILITGLSFSVYLLEQFFSKKTGGKTKITIVLICLVAVFGVLILFESGYGGRFFEHDIDEDGSILARLEVWKMFDLSTDFIFCGISDIEELAIRILGSNHIENWFILMCLQIGLLFTILLICLFVPIFKIFLLPFNRFHALLVLGICLLISSTNNSLACGVPAISMFFTCCYAFAPSKYVNHISPIK